VTVGSGVAVSVGSGVGVSTSAVGTTVGITVGTAVGWGEDCEAHPASKTASAKNNGSTNPFIV